MSDRNVRIGRWTSGEQGGCERGCPPESTASDADPPAAVRTEAVLKAQDPPYQGPDCFGTIARLASGIRHFRPSRAPPSGDLQGAHPMFTTLFDRIWRISVTAGPLIAIALSLAAGRRWV